MSIPPDNYVTCINCGYLMLGFNHNQLKTAVNCPRCNAKDQFGPGIYIDDFVGYTFEEAIQHSKKRKS